MVMNSKRWFSSFIILVLIISLLAGCAAPGQDVNVQANQTQASDALQGDQATNAGSIEQPTASSEAEKSEAAVTTDTPKSTSTGSTEKEQPTDAAGDKPATASPKPDAKSTKAPAAKDQITAPSAIPSATAKPVKMEKPVPAETPQPANIVTISIIADEETGTVLEPTAVELKKDDTVLEVLKRITRKNKIQMEYKGLKAAAYIEGIDNVYEFDHGAKSGWMYRVNGEFPNKSAGAYALKEGDVIEWLYTIDLGKDLGAEYE
jgi:hypothetical protein